MMKKERTIAENEGFFVMAIVLITVGIVMILQGDIIGVIPWVIGIGIVVARGVMFMKEARKKGRKGRTKNETEEAMGCFDKAIELDPNLVEAWTNKGAVLIDLKRYEKALRCFEKVIDLKPKYAPAWNNRGVALGSLERYDEAVGCFDKAIDFDPDLALAQTNRGMALSNL